MSTSRPFYTRRIHDGGSKTESETVLADINFVGSTTGDRSAFNTTKGGFNPTVRHDVEYGDAESEEGGSYMRQGIPK